MERSDATALRDALSELPSRCRYHGDRTDPPDGLIRREACCDTGVAAHRRKKAEAVLNRLTGVVADERDFVDTYANPALIGRGE
ncbi:hypothetical protein [Streptomyces griseus]|uniref:hypothetical protein n=1 Tax=Streptomyces griseus TaxID=1911 RepID=UPI0033BC6E65